MNGIPAVSKNAVLNLVCLLLVPVTLLMGCKSSGVKLYDHYADGSIHSTYSGSGAFIHDSIESKFERAISSGDLPLVEQYLNQGADPDNAV